MYCYGYCIAMFYLCMSYRCRVHSLFQEIDKLAFIVKVCSGGISIGAQVVSLLVELLWDKAPNKHQGSLCFPNIVDPALNCLGAGLGAGI